MADVTMFWVNACVVLLFWFTLSSATSAEPQGHVACPVNCSCVHNMFTCNTRDLRELKNITNFKNIQLNLSFNGITDISGFSGHFLGVIYLSLAGNDLSSVNDGAFDGFENLQELHLENNKIEHVAPEAFRGLHQLKILRMEGNRYSTLPTHILSIPSLTNLTVDSAEPCMHCQVELRRNQTVKGTTKAWLNLLPFNQVNRNCCLQVQCDYYTSLCNSSRSNSHTSEHDATRLISTITPSHVTQHNSTNVTQQHQNIFANNIPLKVVTWFLGLVSVLANFVVMGTVFSRRRLYRVKTMFLAGNVATCDFFIGFYVLMIAASEAETRESLIDRRELFGEEWACPVIMLFRGAGLTMEPFALFVLTLDRYKLVVNYRRPAMRISRRTVKIAMFLYWLLGFALQFSVVAYEGVDSYQGQFCAGRRDNKSISFYLEQIVIILSAALFIVSCTMYAAIYRNVKRHSLRAGTRRYVRISKQLATLVISTFVFWFLPAAITAVAAFFHQSEGELDIGVRRWCIVLFFTANACINPFLYVFRDSNFRKAVRNIVPCLVSRRQERRIEARHGHNGGQNR